ncbi:MAG: hypothetical protein JWQ53_3074 [Klenkia sp.]|nr:hypothetical protein [Klenkia sp.]
MSTRRVRLLAPFTLAAALLVTSCSDTDGDASPAATSTSSTPAATSPEPAPAEAEESAAAALDPAAVTSPDQAALASALRVADLPEGWDVQSNPVEDGDLSDNPSFEGLCETSFPSEVRRTAKFPVVAVDETGAPQLTSESISYDGADAAAQALAELRTAFAGCESADRTFVTPPSAEGLTADSVVVQYQLSSGTPQVIVAQARGTVVSVVIGDDPDATLSAARSIAARMAQLPAAVIGA